MVCARSTKLSRRAPNCHIAPATCARRVAVARLAAAAPMHACLAAIALDATFRDWNNCEQPGWVAARANPELRTRSMAVTG